MSMALAKDTRMGLVDNYEYYEGEFGVLHGSDDHSSPELYPINEEGKNSKKTSPNVAKNIGMSSSSSLSSPSSSNSNGHSVINFKAGFVNYMNSSGSFLNFEQSERFFQNPMECSVWEDNLQYNSNNSSNTSIENSKNIIQQANSYGSTSNGIPFGWLNSEAIASTTTVQELARQDYKRPCTEESMQSNKKQCNAGSNKGKPNNSIDTKDPQSIAAKNRRERISERLKILQELVPNGSKVDLVTMLEKAISYVKFLQLQVKVLATDEFWPAQGGKAPDISQVKEAIDAILRDRNITSK